MQRCLQQQGGSRCLQLAVQLQQQQPLNAAWGILLQQNLMQQLQGASDDSTWQILHSYLQHFAKLPGLMEPLARQLFIQLQLRLNQTDAVSLNEVKALATLYQDQPALLMQLLSIIWQWPAITAPQNLVWLQQVVQHQPALVEDPVGVQIMQAALQQLPLSQGHLLQSLYNAHYQASLKPYLEAHIDDVTQPILRHHAYQLLSSASPLNPTAQFNYHWRNLLSGNSDTDSAFQAAVDYFSKFNQLNILDTPEIPESLDFSHFPNLDKIADHYLLQALPIIIQFAPAATRHYMQKNLLDRQHHWRRANSYTTLKNHDGLEAGMERRYHLLNLSLASYDALTDWLVESIDYFAKHDKAQLQNFANRIRQLKSRVSAEDVASYNQIEHYTRTKIGRRN